MYKIICSYCFYLIIIIIVRIIVYIVSNSLFFPPSGHEKGLGLHTYFGFDNFVIKIGTKEVEFVAFTDTYLKILTLFLIPHLDIIPGVLKPLLSSVPVLEGTKNTFFVEISEFSGINTGSTSLEYSTLRFFAGILVVFVGVLGSFTFTTFINVGNPCSSNPPE